MADPHKSYTPQPSEYEGEFYIDPTSSFDYGGVHINSGISNHCFYLIATSLSAIIALKVYYDCLHKVPSTCSYKEFAKLLRVSAEDLGHDAIVNESLNRVNLPLVPKKVGIKRNGFCWVRRKLGLD
jgi:Zn-dependent metalloprotease